MAVPIFGSQFGVQIWSPFWTLIWTPFLEGAWRGCFFGRVAVLCKILGVLRGCFERCRFEQNPRGLDGAALGRCRFVQNPGGLKRAALGRCRFVQNPGGLEGLFWGVAVLCKIPGPGGVVSLALKGDPVSNRCRIVPVRSESTF